MRKLTGLFALMAVVVMATGCAYSSGLSTGQASVGVHSSAHGWKTPAFTSDLESNPVKSELVVGFVTIGSQAGFAPHPDGKWASFNCDLGPLEESEE